MQEQFQKSTVVVAQKQNEFRGVSSIVNHKPNQKSEFQDRFKGKTSLMNKEGHIGIVQNTQKPIAKGGAIQPILKRSETLDHSYSSSTIGTIQSNDNNGANMSNANYFRKQEANNRYDHSGNVTRSMILNTYDNGYEKASSPLMRVGSTITTQISSPGQAGLFNGVSNDQMQMNNGNMVQGDINQYGYNQPVYSPMALQNYNNVAAASFYSHQPFGQQPGFMNSFGGNMGMIRNPMDQMGYGSYTMNFNRNQMQPTFYSEQAFQQQPLLSFRNNQQQQANYMPQINNNVSKYQEFVNQVNKQKLDTINQTNGLMNLQNNRSSPQNRITRTQTIENSPSEQLQLHQMSQQQPVRNKPNKGSVRVTRSIEVSTLKRSPQQVPA
ncbi:UNKNOWN [Stylonychia lemnae]|uniref:Uncharacterized protein n=1 Tax=Stylonychia lemnae TaxID=5949 RepID=A0A077ZWR1_STYLE|nr:UNKNOWN [Stylonychia lemnae]|eukprot:CDW72926.1 UNKNOWN [Stylonychia lemnae]